MKYAMFQSNRGSCVPIPFVSSLHVCFCSFRGLFTLHRDGEQLKEDNEGLLALACREVIDG